MTLVPAIVILVARNADKGCAKTVFVYLAVTHPRRCGNLDRDPVLAIGDPAAISSGIGLDIVAIVLTRWSGWGPRPERRRFTLVTARASHCCSRVSADGAE